MPRTQKSLVGCVVVLNSLGVHITPSSCMCPIALTIEDLQELSIAPSHTFSEGGLRLCIALQK